MRPLPRSRVLLILAVVAALSCACAAGAGLQRFPEQGFEIAVPSGWSVAEGQDPASGALLLALGDPVAGDADRRPFLSCRMERTGGVQWVMERLLMVSSLRERGAEFPEFEPYAAGGLQGYAFSLYRPSDDLRVDYVGFERNGRVVVCAWGYRSPERARVAASRASLRATGAVEGRAGQR